MYEYKATVTKVYDGDTITVDFDLGFGIILKKQTIRLFGINTPEVREQRKPMASFPVMPSAKEYLASKSSSRLPKIRKVR